MNYLKLPKKMSTSNHKNENKDKCIMRKQCSIFQFSNFISNTLIKYGSIKFIQTIDKCCSSGGLAAKTTGAGELNGNVLAIEVGQNSKKLPVLFISHKKCNEHSSRCQKVCIVKS